MYTKAKMVEKTSPFTDQNTVLYQELLYSWYTDEKRQRHIIIARDIRPPKPHLGILSCPISCDRFSVEKLQAILELQTAFTTSIIPSKHAGSLKFD